MNYAREIGALLAGQQAITLTGGIGGHQTVKDVAMDAAATGRRISIMKGGAGVVLQDKHLTLNSGMEDARNVLNAYAADAVIALSGGFGTLTEVAFAAIAGRLILFLESRAALAKHINNMATIAEQCVAEFPGQPFDNASLQQAVRPLLASSQNDVATAHEAVSRAIAAARVGALLDLPRQPGVAAQYELKLLQLDS